MKYIFNAPLSIKTAKSASGKYYRINLNQYRNWKSMVSNAIKIKYKEVVSPQFKKIKIKPPVQITFVLYNDSNRRIDRANPLSIHEKFFCDALVEAGCMPDDNDKFITRTIYESGPVDKNNGRVEIIIEELGESK